MKIERADGNDAGAVADLIGMAFRELAVARWLVPDRTERARILPAQFRILVDHAIEYGEVHLTDDGLAAAVWFPRPHGAPPPPEDYDARLARICGIWTDRFHLLDELFDARHPTRGHHHLTLLAVLPGHQGAGRGSALLRHHHGVLDATGMPAYLEASSQESRDLYLKHGYALLGDPIVVPSGAELFPMWRG